MSWLKKPYSKGKAYLHTLREKTPRSPLPGSRQLLNKNLFPLSKGQQDESKNNTNHHLARTNKQPSESKDSVVTGQRGQSKGSFYKLNFSRVLDEKESYGSERLDQSRSSLDTCCFTASRPPAITTSADDHVRATKS